MDLREVRPDVGLSAPGRRVARASRSHALPRRAEVVVLTVGGEEPFDLDDAQLSELESRMAAADRGETEPAEAVLAKLRGR